MKEINVHGKNVVSIWPFDLTKWLDRILFKDLINELAFTYDNLILTAKKSNETTILKRVLNQELQSQLLGCYLSKDYTEIVIACELSKNPNIMVDVLPELWAQYEQPVVICTNFNLKGLSTQEFYKINSFYLDEIESSFPGIYLYKGVEDDVLWVQTSSEYSLPNIEQILKEKIKLIKF